MKNDYSIREILDAVDEIQNIKKEKISKLDNKKFIQKDFNEVSKDTLKIIEEAEKTKF